MTLSDKALGKRKLEDRDSDSGSDADEALAMLHAGGQAFLQSFGQLPKIFQAPSPIMENFKAGSESPNFEEHEWGGISEDDDNPREESFDKLFMPSHKVLPNLPPSLEIQSNVIVFKDRSRTGTQTASLSKEAKRALMSTKVSKIHAVQEVDETQRAEEVDEGAGVTMDQHDKELYKLLHTRLLTGSATSSVHTTNGQRRRALEGRILELSGKAKVGEGTKTLLHTYKNHQPKRQRDVLETKEKRIDSSRRTEAEENGLFHAERKKSMFLQKQKQKTRIKGIGSGVGKYKNGTLTLSRSDISSIMGR